MAPWHLLAPNFKSISENPLSRKTLKKRCQKVPRCQAYTSLLFCMLFHSTITNSFSLFTCKPLCEIVWVRIIVITWKGVTCDLLWPFFQSFSWIGFLGHTFEIRSQKVTGHKAAHTFPSFLITHSWLLDVERNVPLLFCRLFHSTIGRPPFLSNHFLNSFNFIHSPNSFTYEKSRQHRLLMLSSLAFLSIISISFAEKTSRLQCLKSPKNPIN